MKKKYYEMDICPVCGKKFLYNPHSIYKIKVNNVTKMCCSYKCWRVMGGDN